VNDPTPKQSEHQRTTTEVIPPIRTTANPHERERPRRIRAMNGLCGVDLAGRTARRKPGEARPGVASRSAAVEGGSAVTNPAWTVVRYSAPVPHRWCWSQSDGLGRGSSGGSCSFRCSRPFSLRCNRGPDLHRVHHEPRAMLAGRSTGASSPTPFSESGSESRHYPSENRSVARRGRLNQYSARLAWAGVRLTGATLTSEHRVDVAMEMAHHPSLSLDSEVA
jgi:hypothetical protein